MADLSLPALCKDDIKEALFDVLGISDRTGSRRFSDASFSVLLRLARRQLDAGLSCMIEGNWRREHAAGLLAILASGARAAQIWCHASPRELARRFTERTRHPGHLDGTVPGRPLEQAAPEHPAFFDLGGPQWVYDSERTDGYPGLVRDLQFWRL
jgi:predicted kinase